MRVYKKEGKSAKWWQVNANLQEEIASSKSDFVERLLEEGSGGKSFYAATKELSTSKATQAWTVSDLFVGLKDEEVAEKVLDYFSGIAKSDRPGVPDLPRVHGSLDEFTTDRTAGLLRSAKKTDSILEGDHYRGYSGHTLSSSLCRYPSSLTASTKQEDGQRSGRRSTSPSFLWFPTLPDSRSAGILVARPLSRKYWKARSS